ncbi:MAG: AtpZ/AtpI family protein [Gemmatales bacterium]|nr:AtpZ/AtpI family protein [Gemmatales bacterium]MCS7161601.1 AtpZ/AtpI family protein [Gemmatales bacterium]MDW8176804.1 AtpZ/AtpI family protein [Gemmatales bacterium]MDW8221775.1 AtpZ/AtpI family protein [Gemmatales bacterium]
MVLKGASPREVGRYFALAQVGLEMALPIAVGAWLDYRWGTMPWLVITGVIVGFAVGMIHLWLLLRESPGQPSSKDSTP